MGADRSQVVEKRLARIESRRLGDRTWDEVIFAHNGSPEPMDDEAWLAYQLRELARQLEQVEVENKRLRASGAYEEQIARLEAVEAERDRYREALEQIADEQLRDDLKFDHEIARAALHPKERDDG